MAEAGLAGTAHEGTASTTSLAPPLPPDALIIIPVRNVVLFPGHVMPITIGRPGSVAAAQQALRDQRQVGILMQRSPDVADPTPIDMHRLGSVANIVRYITGADGTNHLICQGDQRLQVLEFLSGWPFLVARVLRIPEPDARSPEIEARFVYLKTQATEALQLLPQAPEDLLAAIHSVTSPAALADLTSAYMDMKPEEKQEILETIDAAARMEKVSRLLAHRHRRTYIGALPGNIIQAIRKVGARNCVMMLDEIDKVGAGIQGDPSAALLEVLDPEQNHTFRDNYLGVPFDLSRVVFITTANILDTIPGPLRDRMEIIGLAGYTANEKFEIARRYLVPRQMEANGVQPGQVEIAEEALRDIIQHYTREAGVRNLEREIGKTLRHAAVRIAEGQTGRIQIARENLADILGAPQFESELAMRTSVPGVATGLAWTPVGGDILFIEATRAPGSGKLILTGQLGEVMRESAQAALSIVKNRAGSFGIEATEFGKSDIHIHVPAGAIPKDGPSAGVAMFMALVSLMTERTVRNDTAMTGEISLRGLVLPVGGIKEKVVAAHRAGIKRVMLPARNRKDFEDIPAKSRKELEFIWLERVDEAVSTALESKTAAHNLSAGTSIRHMAGSDAQARL